METKPETIHSKLATSKPYLSQPANFRRSASSKWKLAAVPLGAVLVTSFSSLDAAAAEPTTEDFEQTPIVAAEESFDQPVGQTVNQVETETATTTEFELIENTDLNQSDTVSDSTEPVESTDLLASEQVTDPETTEATETTGTAGAVADSENSEYAKNAEITNATATIETEQSIENVEIAVTERDGEDDKAAEITKTEETEDIESAKDSAMTADDLATDETMATAPDQQSELSVPEMPREEVLELIGQMAEQFFNLATDGEPAENQIMLLADLIGNPTTYQEVYDRMIALKEKYPEGLDWTNNTPYTMSGSYDWRGGAVKLTPTSRPVNGGVGCAAFAMILSDEAFGDLPARVIVGGDFTFDDVRVGDLLAVDYGSHFVIVLQKSAGGLTVAEGNYNKSVHWGRVISETEVMDTTIALITRYPTNFVPADDAEAETIVQNGTEGNLNWSLTKSGTLTISGSGMMTNYTSGGQKPSWSDYASQINSIVIEEGITNIGDYAFSETQALSIYLPETLTSIGQGAFYKSSLVSVTIPSAVQTVGKDAFYMNPNLVSVSINHGVQEIGDQAFRGCNALRYIDIPSTVRSLGAGAFMSCAEMTRVRFVPGTETVQMGDNLFSQCWKLTDLTLPYTMDRISAGMFYSCRGLINVYIPGNVSEIGEQAFTQCVLLQYDGIYFGGDETTWNSIGGKAALLTLMPYQVTVHYGVAFENPFAPIDGNTGYVPLPSDDEDKDNNEGGGSDAGNEGGGNTGGEDDKGSTGDTGDSSDDKGNENQGGSTGDNQGATGGADDDKSETDPQPSEHQHVWSLDWTHNNEYHWHDCLISGCPVVVPSDNAGYVRHDYGDWFIDLDPTIFLEGSKHRDCIICSYREIAAIPIIVNPDSGSSSDAGSSSGSNSGSTPGPDTGSNTGHPNGSTNTSGTQGSQSSNNSSRPGSSQPNIVPTVSGGASSTSWFGVGSNVGSSYGRSIYQSQISSHTDASTNDGNIDNRTRLDITATEKTPNDSDSAIISNRSQDDQKSTQNPEPTFGTLDPKPHVTENSDQIPEIMDATEGTKSLSKLLHYILIALVAICGGFAVSGFIAYRLKVHQLEADWGDFDFKGSDANSESDDVDDVAK